MRYSVATIHHKKSPLLWYLQVPLVQLRLWPVFVLATPMRRIFRHATHWLKVTAANTHACKCNYVCMQNFVACFHQKILSDVVVLCVPVIRSVFKSHQAEPFIPHLAWWTQTRRFGGSAEERHVLLSLFYSVCLSTRDTLTLNVWRTPRA